MREGGKSSRNLVGVFRYSKHANQDGKIVTEQKLTFVNLVVTRIPSSNIIVYGRYKGFVFRLKSVFGFAVVTPEIRQTTSSKKEVRDISNHFARPLS